MKALLALAALAGLTSTALASDQTFTDFAVQQARLRGSKSCEAAIREVFSGAGGEDMRVLTDSLKGINSDQLQMVAVYGAPNDAVVVKVMVRSKGSQCFTQRAATVVMPTSCDEWLARNTAFKVRSSTVGVRFAKNAGGVDALLRSAGDQHCVVTYRGGNIF